MRVSFSSEASDLDLLRSAKGGDYDAFTALVDRFRPRVYSMSRRIVRQPADAEDVTQQTFLSLIEHLETFREESSVATWVFRIATNHALKLLRRQRTRHEIALDITDSDDTYSSLPHPDYIAQWQDMPDVLAQRAETAAILNDALVGLNEKYRVVFVLRDLEGLSVKETAEALELTESAVKVRLLRARLMLRERMTQAFGDENTRVISNHNHPTAAPANEGGKP